MNIEDIDGLALSVAERVSAVQATSATTVVAAVLVVGVLLLRGLLLRSVRRQVGRGPVEKQWRRTSWYVALGLCLLVVLPLWVDQLRTIGTFLGLFTAGLAMTLSAPLQCVAGWCHLVTRRPYRIGERVQLGGHVGVVQDITLFSTVLMETGVEGRNGMPTGRLVHVQNRCVFDEVLVTTSRDGPLIWHEVPMVLTFESDWQRGQRLLRSAVEDALRSERAMDRRRLDATLALLDLDRMHGRVTEHVRAVEHGVEVAVRFPCAPERVRQVEDHVWGEVLAAMVDVQALELAYPTRRNVN